MISEPPADERKLRTLRLETEVAVVGGGLAGACCAITAARAGSKVVLVQDRPVLGGNASSEVRLWILGATSHMGNNNRWAREGGVIDELLVENLYRNPEGNPCILDAIILELVARERNITLLLNTAVQGVEKSGPDTIRSVQAFCSQNSTAYEITAPLYVDASGDGIVGFLAGAAFRMGGESRAELGEGLAPEESSSELLGHTLYFYSKDTGRPVKYIAPSFALKDITRIPRWRDIEAHDYGCRFWWFEWGGKFDTVYEAETIKWELWKVVYGVWDYVKNSGKFPEAETMTLEWVGAIPGKRESRRFEGDYLLRQQDVVEQRQHADAVSYGGWAIDLHPADGVYSEEAGCRQWHSKGVYQIPYRCLYSRNISNLFLAGRSISASHIAFGSTRVMATCAHNGQVVGLAAALCRRHGVQPRELLAPALMTELQRELLRTGQFIPGVALAQEDDLAQKASLTASSELELSELQPSGETLELENSLAMMLPVAAGRMPRVEYLVDVAKETTLRAELRVSSKQDNHTPDVTLAVLELPLKAGRKLTVALNFAASIDAPRYAFVCLIANEAVAVHLSEQRVTGVLSVVHEFSRQVATSSRQEPPPDSGLERFEFWLPQRRPAGKNLALKIDPPLGCFGVENLRYGGGRPTHQPNAWVAGFAHEQPVLRLKWAERQTVARIDLCFDTDFDHPMESVLMGHPERVMPFCVPEVVISTPVNVPVPAGAGGGVESAGTGSLGLESQRVLWEISENHQSRQVIRLAQPICTDCLEFRLVAPSVHVPAALFEVHCYETA